MQILTIEHEIGVWGNVYTFSLRDETGEVIGGSTNRWDFLPGMLQEIGIRLPAECGKYSAWKVVFDLEKGTHAMKGRHFLSTRSLDSKSLAV